MAHLSIAECKKVFEKHPDATITSADGLRWFNRDLANQMGLSTHMISTAAMDHLRDRGLIKLERRGKSYAIWVRDTEKPLSGREPK